MKLPKLPKYPCSIWCRPLTPPAGSKCDLGEPCEGIQIDSLEAVAVDPPAHFDPPPDVEAQLVLNDDISRMRKKHYMEFAKELGIVLFWGSWVIILIAIMWCQEPKS